MWGRVFDLSNKKCVELDGFFLHVMPDDYIGASIIASRTYEPHVTALIRRELRQGDTFLDVGGNIGYFSMLASSIVGAAGKVITFEPNPQNLQLIYESLLKNGFSNQTIYPYAVSDHTGILRFTTVGSNGGVVTEHSRDQRHYLLVQSVLIDDVLSDQPINMVKIDIEAHEPFAIRGMARLLKKHRPKIITEFHPWAMQLNNTEAPEEYLAQLEQLGYRLGIICPSNVERMDRRAILAYWESLKQPTIRLDLYCEPTN
jgi:FkbM family methyltransferase